MSDAPDADQPMSLARKRELLGLTNLGREALESEPGPDPTPTPLGAGLSPGAIEIMSTTADGRARLEAMGVRPVSTIHMSHCLDRRPGGSSLQ